MAKKVAATKSKPKAQKASKADAAPAPVDPTPKAKETDVSAASPTPVVEAKKTPAESTKPALKKTVSGRVSKSKKSKQNPANSEKKEEDVSAVDAELDGIKVYMPEDESDDDDTAILQGIDDEALETTDDIDAMDEFVDNTNLVLLREEDTTKLRKATDDMRKTTAVKRGSSKEEPGVIYLGRIPHGFYEREMKSYFSQFGDVSRLRLSRNKKTGKSRHYAFIEFKDSAVAKIVAETMDNYLMFNHILKCTVVPAEKLHPDTFKNCERNFRVVPWNKIQMRKQNKPKTQEQWAANVKSLKRKEDKKRKMIAELGIDYEFPGYNKAAQGVVSPVKAVLADTSNTDAEKVVKKDAKKVATVEQKMDKKDSKKDAAVEQKVTKKDSKKVDKKDAKKDVAVEKEVKKSTPVEEKEAKKNAAKSAMIEEQLAKKDVKATKKAVAEEKKDTKATKNSESKVVKKTKKSAKTKKQ